MTADQEAGRYYVCSALPHVDQPSELRFRVERNGEAVAYCRHLDRAKYIASALNRLLGFPA